MIDFNNSNPEYLHHIRIQNMKNQINFMLVNALVCLLLWVDNSVPILPFSFSYSLDYYNVSGFFFFFFLSNWVFLKLTDHYKKVQNFTIWLSLIGCFAFINCIGYLEIARGSGLTAVALGYIITAVIFSARQLTLILLFLANGMFLYEITSNINGIDISNYKMAIISIVLLSIIVFTTTEKQRRRVFETQRMLAGKIEELNKALDVKSVFFGHMSHELRTPLNAIIGFSEMIMKDTYYPKTIDKIKEYNEFIHSGGHHLLKIVNDILDSSKIEAGEVSVFFEEIDLGEVLQDYIDELSSITQDKNQTVRLILEKNSIALNSDRRLLKQIIFNLISNAQKFTPSGGLIEIYATHSEKENIDITVKDNGKGMTEDMIRFINDTSKPLKTHFITKADDTGLGLVIVRQLVQLLQGDINFNSNLGFGTEVKLSFPQLARPTLN